MEELGLGRHQNAYIYTQCSDWMYKGNMKSLKLRSRRKKKVAEKDQNLHRDVRIDCKSLMARIVFKDKH